MRFSMTNLARIFIFAVYAAHLLAAGLSALDAASLLSKKTLSRQEFEATLASLDAQTQKNIILNKKEFLTLLEKIIKEPRELTMLVDKQHKLSSHYAPDDLTDLSEQSWARVKRKHLMVSSLIMKDLEKMIKAAEKDGIALYVASGYRSYAYQKKTYAGWIEKLGRKEAMRISAPAGASQHQLGTVIDFYPINSSFTGTPAQVWLVENAHKYGFSLSFPAAHEKQTGYKYESWHYRYIGPHAIQIQQKFFGGLQYRFLTWWNGQRHFYTQKVHK